MLAKYREKVYSREQMSKKEVSPQEEPKREAIDEAVDLVSATDEGTTADTLIRVIREPEDVKVVTEEVLAAFPENCVSGEGLEEFLAGLHANPNVVGAVFVDHPVSNGQSVLETLVLGKRPGSMLDLAVLDEVKDVHTLFVGKNDQSLPNLYDSFVLITTQIETPSIDALVMSLRSRDLDTFSRVVTGIEFARGDIQPRS